MSARMKKRPTGDVRVTIDGGKRRVFSVPKKRARGLVMLLESFEIRGQDRGGGIPWEQVAKDRILKHGKGGLALKGARMKFEMSQADLAKKLGIAQYNISKMENNKRPIGKKMAMRLAKVFKTDYRVFL